MAGTITAEEVAGNRPSSCAGRHRRIHDAFAVVAALSIAAIVAATLIGHSSPARSAAPPSASPAPSPQAVPSNQEISMTTDQHTHCRPAIWRVVRGVAAALRTLHRENTLAWAVVASQPGDRPPRRPARLGPHPRRPPAGRQPPPHPTQRPRRRLGVSGAYVRARCSRGGTCGLGLGCSSCSLALTLKRDHAWL
jgi:hypothetical protein